MLSLVIRATAGIALALCLAGLPAAPASAQACTSDFQCSPSPSGQNVCLGDTLIVRRSICVAGQCQTQETSRQNCGGGLGGSCVGNTFVRSGGRCDALSGRCVQGGGIQIQCVKSCSCQAGTLTISTGTCTSAGCGRSVMRCKGGCTCSPEPKCLGDPELKDEAVKKKTKRTKAQERREIPPPE